MKRGTPLNKFATIPRYVRVRKKRKGGPRRGPLRDKAFRQFVSKFPCVACRVIAGLPPIPDFDSWPREVSISQASHSQNNEQSSKGSDSTCAPLCTVDILDHHTEYDANRKAFEKKYGVNMRALAAQYWARYQEEHSA